MVAHALPRIEQRPIQEPTRTPNQVETMEKRTARLTLLIDPTKKAAFEQLCFEKDVTPSQMVRKFIREYLEQELGPDWRDRAPDADKDL